MSSHNWKHSAALKVVFARRWASDVEETRRQSSGRQPRDQGVVSLDLTQRRMFCLEGSGGHDRVCKGLRDRWMFSGTGAEDVGCLSAQLCARKHMVFVRLPGRPLRGNRRQRTQRGAASDLWPQGCHHRHTKFLVSTAGWVGPAQRGCPWHRKINHAPHGQ